MRCWAAPRRQSCTARHTAPHQAHPPPYPGTGAEPNEVAGEDYTPVNLMNAENATGRLMAYYGSVRRIKADLVMTSQRHGGAVAFTDPFCTGKIRIVLIGGGVHRCSRR